MSVTLSELKTRARERADMLDSNFVTDTELLSYINASVAELHDLLVQSYGSDYKVKDSTFTTTSGVDTYALSTVITDDDFYKLRGVDAKLNGTDFFTLRPFNFNERNRFQHFGSWDYLGIANVRYRLLGDNIIFTPEPDGGVDVKIWYIPVAAKLVSDSDTLDDLNQYAEYIVVDVAIKMLNKEESDVTVLTNQKAALKRRIEEAANNRDAGSAESVTDIYAENIDFYFGRTNS